MVTLLAVEDMTCEHCVARVKNALESLNGVEMAVVNLEEGSASVTHSDAVSRGQMIDALDEAGYPAE